MFIEETCESFIETLLKSAKDNGPTYIEAMKAVKVIEAGDVTIDNIEDYANHEPAIIFNVGEENRATSPLSAKNDAQNMVFILNVFVFVSNKYGKNSKTTEARPILRAVRELLRGLRYTAADGATEGVARIMYQSQDKVAEAGALGLYLQTYEIHSQDFNDTRRDL